MMAKSAPGDPLDPENRVAQGEGDARRAGRHHRLRPGRLAGRHPDDRAPGIPFALRHAVFGIERIARRTAGLRAAAMAKSAPAARAAPATSYGLREAVCGSERLPRRPGGSRAAATAKSAPAARAAPSTSAENSPE